MSRDGEWDDFLGWAVPAGIGRGIHSFRAEIKLTGGDAYIFKDNFNIYLPLAAKEESSLQLINSLGGDAPAIITSSQ